MIDRENEMTKKAKKLQFHLVDIEFIEMMAKVLMFGNTKHLPNSWKQETNLSLYWDALIRHFFAYRNGEYNAPDSELPHLVHIAVNAMILHWLETNKNEKENVMETENLKEVNFSKYCKTCKHYEKSEHEDPCDDCIATPVKLYSTIPMEYEEA